MTKHIHNMLPIPHGRHSELFPRVPTNAYAESLNAKIKAFRASLRGVMDVQFFLYRLSLLFA